MLLDTICKIIMNQKLRPESLKSECLGLVQLQFSWVARASAANAIGESTSQGMSQSKEAPVSKQKAPLWSNPMKFLTPNARQPVQWKVRRPDWTLFRRSDATGCAWFRLRLRRIPSVSLLEPHELNMISGYSCYWMRFDESNDDHCDHDHQHHHHHHHHRHHNNNNSNNNNNNNNNNEGWEH